MSALRRSALTVALLIFAVSYPAAAVPASCGDWCCTGSRWFSSCQCPENPAILTTCAGYANHACATVPWCEALVVPQGPEELLAALLADPAAEEPAVVPPPAALSLNPAGR